MTTRLLFVYGSLRRDIGRMRPEDSREAASRLHREGRFLGLAKTRGRLIALAWYPGLVSGRNRVRGEVWRVDDRLLAFLDNYEGEGYARCRVLVELAGGRATPAFAWLWTGSPRAPAIPGGDYLAWLRSARRRVSRKA